MKKKTRRAGNVAQVILLNNEQHSTTVIVRDRSIIVGLDANVIGD